MLLRCVIIDDDTVFTKIVEHYISKIDFMELSNKYSDADSAASSIDFNKVDLLFLDIEMPGMSGIEFLNSLPIAPPVIIVSRKKDYGVDAFDHDSIDYLHKPVSFPRFLKAANKARKFFEQANRPERNNKDNLFVRQERMWIRIPINEILYIKADDNDVIIKVPDKTYKTHSKLTDIYQQLPQKDFLQVHRSYVVQLQKIDKIDGEIIEINARTIPVSKGHLKELRDRLNIF
jgi:DNA-binding LytR/AlgR family response regulator